MQTCTGSLGPSISCLALTTARHTNFGSYPQADLCSVLYLLRTVWDLTSVWMLPPPAAFTCRCHHLSYQPGDQVFLCYGRHTNLELLELYGFMLPDNPHDVALLPPDTFEQHMQQAARGFHHQQQQQPGVPGRRAHCRQPHKHQEQQHTVAVDVSQVDCWVHANGQPSWHLLCALR